MQKNVLIIGLGLIGSSLARGLKEYASDRYKVYGQARRKETIEYALRNKVIDEEFLGSENIDIVVLCTPLSSYVNIYKALPEHIKENAIITDAGSVKSSISSELLDLIDDKNLKSKWIPAHPIAGKEIAGIESGEADLYKGKKVIVTPTIYNENKELDEVANMWQSIGAYTEMMDIDHHDKLYGDVSHLCQMVAYAFGKSFANEADSLDEYYYNNFIRLTRSDATMWADICLYNSKNILKALRGFEALLSVDNLQESYKKYLKFTGKKDFQEKFVPSGDVLTEILPLTISSALINYVDIELESYVHNSGYISMTEFVYLADIYPFSNIEEKNLLISEKLTKFKLNLNDLCGLIENADKVSLLEYFNSSEIS